MRGRILSSPLRFVCAAMLIGSVALILTCLLPHDRYVRFQNLTDPAVVKSTWIYERIHFDPTPIDVAFIGTSHTVFGIDSATIEDACTKAGGADCHTVNLGLEHLGRNLHWLFLRELLENRKPRLIVIEVQETEFRALHPAFGYLANVGDIISAPILINTSFLTDLVHLPLRQISLFAYSTVPSAFGFHSAFQPSMYRGAHWDDTLEARGSVDHPISSPEPRTRASTRPELEREARQVAVDDAGHIRLPEQLHSLEYRANVQYLRMMVDLAREKHVPVQFLYLPSFGTNSAPAFSDLYAQLAPIWSAPQAILADPGQWLDVGHLNYDGATNISRWLGKEIAQFQGSPGAAISRVGTPVPKIETSSKPE
jgi:hypothetical protein